MIVHAADAVTLGYPCASPRREDWCDERCDGLGCERPDLFLRGPWMPADGPAAWPRCPVDETYNDGCIRHVLQLRRQRQLGSVIDLDAYAAWVGDLWGQLEDLRQEKLEAEAADPRG